MIKTTGGLKRVDIPKTVKAIHKDMTKFVFETLKIWVIKTTNPVPVWSGAARASFLKLATQAQIMVAINPVAPSRIPLGIETSRGDVISIPGKEYGWLWSSDLAHIGIVQDRVGFVEAGLNAIKSREALLPGVVFEAKRK